jgi:hypothetical protein
MKANRQRTRPQTENEETIEDTILSVVRAGIDVILTDLGFYVAEFSFNRLLVDPEFRRMIRESYSDTDVANVLIQAPDLFVMHRKKEPVEGVFFVKCVVTRVKTIKRTQFIEIDSSTRQTYSKFYPCDKLMILVSRRHESSPLLASWLRKTNRFQVDKMKTLRNFIESELHMEPNDELIAKLNRELVKMYEPN